MNKYLDQNGNLTDEYFGYVYVTIDQKYNLKYVGHKKAIVEKTKSYFGSGRRINNIQKSRGTYFLKKIILGVCYTNEELTECETECKHFFNSLNKLYGYNILEKDTYGDTYTNLTEEEKIERSKKLSDACSGEKNGMFGKQHSEETRKQISGIIKQSWVDNPNQGLKNKKFTIEHRQKISISHKKENLSIETIKKMSISKKIAYSNKKHPKYRHDIDNNIETIISLKENGKSSRELALIFNCSTSSINRRIREYKINKLRNK